MATGRSVTRTARALGAIAAAWACPLRAQSISLDTLSLYELPGVMVVVKPLGAAAERDGLHADSLHELVTTRLDDAQIPVLSENDWQNTLGNPLLYLKIDLLHPSQYLYLYNIELELRQLVVLARDSTIPVFTTTWEAGDVVGSVRASNISSLHQYVLSAVEHFISAYVAANRRRRLMF